MSSSTRCLPPLSLPPPLALHVLIGGRGAEPDRRPRRGRHIYSLICPLGAAWWLGSRRWSGCWPPRGTRRWSGCWPPRGTRWRAWRRRVLGRRRRAALASLFRGVHCIIYHHHARYTLVLEFAFALIRMTHSTIRRAVAYKFAASGANPTTAFCPFKSRPHLTSKLWINLCCGQYSMRPHQQRSSNGAGGASLRRRSERVPTRGSSS